MVTPAPTCSHCGDTEDVIERWEYVGGCGYKPFLECQDQVACWKRWDAQHRTAESIEKLHLDFKPIDK